MLAAIADDDAHLQAIFELDAATNDRLLAGQSRLPGIGPEELVFGVPNAAVVNASFCHAHPLGARFSGPDRGAWYAGFDLATSQAEVAFHKTVQLAEIDRFDDSVTYDDYLADFSASFHDLRRAKGALRRVPRSGQLRRLAAARRGPAGRRLARRRLSERAPRRRHLRGLLPAGAGDERAQGAHLPLHVERHADAERSRSNARARERLEPAGAAPGRISRRCACPRRAPPRRSRSTVSMPCG